MTAAIELDRVKIRFGTFTAVQETSLEIRAGEFFSFLGPSGCGKTTLLRAISGFVEPSEGSIRIGSRDMRGIGPNRRPTALIFQNLALFPMMSVAENVAYGLRVRGVGRAEREQKAMRLLDQVALTQHAGKMISELSGGQKQRVAIARALAVEPSVLLLDEPLSALDLKLRQHMRRELREMQQRVGITFIYITHDQGEALTMSDRVAVMNAGRIAQVGDGHSIYAHPLNAFVASFVGENNALPGRITARDGDFATIDTAVGGLRARNPHALATGAGAILFIRPERLALLDASSADGLTAQVREIAYEGSETHMALDAGAGHKLMVSLTAADPAGLPQPGSMVRVTTDPERAVILPPEELAR